MVLFLAHFYDMNVRAAVPQNSVMPRNYRNKMEQLEKEYLILLSTIVWGLLVFNSAGQWAWLDNGFQTTSIGKAQVFIIQICTQVLQ